MKKMPTIFERDWEGNRSLVLDRPNPDARWVFDGEGVATEKVDGTSCLIRDGKLYKRYQFKPGRTAPPDFEASEDPDPITEEQTGWVPVGDGPEDKYHREAFAIKTSAWPNATYELIGPKVQGNPYELESHWLVRHDSRTLTDSIPLTFEGIRDFLDSVNMEGIVWHHPDGRMAKIKRRDFNLAWPV